MIFFNKVLLTVIYFLKNKVIHTCVIKVFDKSIPFEDNIKTSYKVEGYAFVNHAGTGVYLLYDDIQSPWILDIQPLGVEIEEPTCNQINEFSSNLTSVWNI